MFDQWDIVKFKTPENDKESNLQFVIIEVRGDRLLVELINCQNLPIPPQFVYLASDMINV